MASVGQAVYAWPHRMKGDRHAQTCFLFALVPVLLAVGLASAQESYPLMEMLAKKVIEKYQTSSCQG